MLDDDTMTRGTAPRLPPGEDWALSLPKLGGGPSGGGGGGLGVLWDEWSPQ